MTLAEMDPRRQAQLAALEINTAKDSLPTGNSHEFVTTVLGITPADIDGKVLVDLASGTSDFVAWCLNNGADAYGFDVAYGKTAEELEELIKIGHQKLLERDLKSAPLSRKSIDERQQIAKNFMESFKDSPNKYIPSYLSDTHLPNGYSDLTTSSYGISVASHPRLLIPNLREAMRITKPSGTILIGGQLGQYEHRRIAREASDNGYTAVIEPVEKLQYSDMERVRITRA